MSRSSLAPSRVGAVLFPVGLALGLAVATPVAHADDGGAGEPAGGDEPGLLVPSEDSAPVSPPPRGHHKGQFGLALSVATGYRFIATWDQERYCGERATANNGGGNAAYCFSRTPFAVDVTVSYGVAEAVELMVDLRFGLERDFGASASSEGPRLRHYAPGVRFFLGGRDRLAYSSSIQLAIDTTGYTDATGELGTDVRLRNANALQLDFHDAYGAFVYFGEELAFRRWFEVGLEAGAGIQGRYP